MMYYFLVVFSVLAAACAQMLLKQGTKKQYPTFWRQYLTPWVIGGYSIMGVALLLNIFLPESWCSSEGSEDNRIIELSFCTGAFMVFLQGKDNMVQS